jgi:hypothetical protein
MNKFFLISFFLALFLLSCRINITNNEDKGIKEIINYYGGKCKYGISYTIAENANKIKCFKLELSQSPLAQRYSKIPEMVASNVAFFFYKNLKGEKNKYDAIQSAIILDDGKEYSFTYSIDQLEIVNKRTSLFNKINNLIKEKDYKAINSLLNDSTLIKYDKAALISNMSKIDSSFGDVKSFNMAGFRFSNLDKGRQILHLCGIIVRKKENNEFSIDIDPNSDNDEIFFLQYRL